MFQEKQTTAPAESYWSKLLSGGFISCQWLGQAVAFDSILALRLERRSAEGFWEWLPSFKKKAFRCTSSLLCWQIIAVFVCNACNCLWAVHCPFERWGEWKEGRKRNLGWWTWLNWPVLGLLDFHICGMEVWGNKILESTLINTFLFPLTTQVINQLLFLSRSHPQFYHLSIIYHLNSALMSWFFSWMSFFWALTIISNWLLYLQPWSLHRSSRL